MVTLVATKYLKLTVSEALIHVSGVSMLGCYSYVYVWYGHKTAMHFMHSTAMAELIVSHKAGEK